MYLYLVSQDVNDDYDTYDSAVVCAANEDAARVTHPDGYHIWDREKADWYSQRVSGERYYEGAYSTWAKPGFVKVELIGEPSTTVKEGVVVASFNAG